MARTTGLRLFTGYRAVNRFFERLDMTLHEACDAYFAKDESKEVNALPVWLYDRFRFHEVGLGYPHQPLSVGLLPTYVRLKTGSIGNYRKVAMTVPFTGSKLLLRTSPVEGFRFSYGGAIGKRSFRIFHLMEDLDPTRFVAVAATELDRVCEALHGGHAMVRSFNDRLQAEIDRKIRAY